MTKSATTTTKSKQLSRTSSTMTGWSTILAEVAVCRRYCWKTSKTCGSNGGIHLIHVLLSQRCYFRRTSNTRINNACSRCYQGKWVLVDSYLVSANDLSKSRDHIFSKRSLFLIYVVREPTYNILLSVNPDQKRITLVFLMHRSYFHAKYAKQGIDKKKEIMLISTEKEKSNHASNHRAFFHPYLDKKHQSGNATQKIKKGTE